MTDIPTDIPTDVPPQRCAAAEEASAAWTDALAEGRVLERIRLTDIHTDDLPRDRLDLEAVAAAPEMAELIASIRVHGQKEAIEVYLSPRGHQLKKGWRRLTALKSLFHETGDERFATALARIDTRLPGGGDSRLRHYIDMVEENVLRQDLSYAEMAATAIKACDDPLLGETSPEDMVNHLFGALTKIKRSHIRSFVTVLEALGDDLKFAPALPRDLGLKVSRLVRTRPDEIAELRHALGKCCDAAEQARVLKDHLRRRELPAFTPVPEARILAEPGALMIEADVDFSAIPPDLLRRAINNLCGAIMRSA